MSRFHASLVVAGFLVVGATLLALSPVSVPAPEDPCPIHNTKTFTISYVRNSVVDIHVILTYMTDEEKPTTYELEWGGSGVIIGKAGLVLTNWHVINDQRLPIKRDYKVTLADGRVFDAAFLRADMEMDLGLLQLSNPPDDLWEAVLADYDPVLGQDVLTFGSPRGLKGSVSHGIVSGLNREISVRLLRREPVASVLYKGMLQIDSPINPGNSGGPVTDTWGRVIGLVNCGGSGDGMGFAIPIQVIHKFLNSD
jgi:S1-C subfamily serine protease